MVQVLRKVHAIDDAAERVRPACPEEPGRAGGGQRVPAHAGDHGR